MAIALKLLYLMVRYIHDSHYTVSNSYSLTPPLNGAQVEKKGRFDSSDGYFISNQAD